MIASTLKTPGEAANPITRNASLKSALVAGSGISFVPMRKTRNENSAYPSREAMSPRTPAIRPARKKFPMSEATPAITITVTACPIAEGSASISVRIFTSAFHRPNHPACQVRHAISSGAILTVNAK